MGGRAAAAAAAAARAVAAAGKHHHEHHDHHDHHHHSHGHHHHHHGHRHPSTHFRVYPSRWFMLVLFSTLALLNNVVCYSFSAITKIAKMDYGPSISISSLVSYFFLAYVVFSFPSSYLIDRYGLRFGVVLGAWMQTVGSALRCLDRFASSGTEFLIAGQIIASLGQAFFVNPPPLMATKWFGGDERTLATTIAVNANTLGIAAAYVIGPLLVTQPADIDAYLTLIFACSLVCAVLATLFYEESPPTPPSLSSQRLLASETPSLNVSSIIDMFSHSGFTHTVLAFALAEATINGFSAFLPVMLLPLGYDSKFIGLMVVCLIVMCMLGSAIVGYAVDQTKAYKLSLFLCFLGSFVGVVAFIESVESWHVIVSVLIIGFFVGPLQPLAIESAVEVTYPDCSAASVTAVQQVLGNLASAALFPLFVALRDPITESMRPAVWCIALSLLGMGVVYLTFNGEYRRLAHELAGHADEDEEDEEHSEVDVEGGGDCCAAAAETADACCNQPLIAGSSASSSLNAAAPTTSTASYVSYHSTSSTHSARTVVVPQ